MKLAASHGLSCVVSLQWKPSGGETRAVFLFGMIGRVRTLQLCRLDRTSCAVALLYGHIDLKLNMELGKRQPFTGSSDWIHAIGGKLSSGARYGMVYMHMQSEFITNDSTISIV